jgi:hypothetical protein
MSEKRTCTHGMMIGAGMEYEILSEQEQKGSQQEGCGGSLVEGTEP